MSPADLHPVTPPTEHPRLFSARSLPGILCFGLGLLILASGILIALAFVITQNPMSFIIGIPVALLGAGLNATGLVLLYRDAVSPKQGLGTASGTPRLEGQGGSNDGS